jgi:hypothetical protein
MRFGRYNGLWTRDVQDVIFCILLCGWLGGSLGGADGKQGRLLTIDEVGEVMKGKHAPTTVRIERFWQVTDGKQFP